MKVSMLLVASLLGLVFVTAPSNDLVTKDGAAIDLLNAIRDPKAGYDEAWAKEIGSDDYGMHQYVMAFLKSGPKREADPEAMKKLQSAHMKNIGRLASEGKLVVAGPFLDNGELRGIYIFNVKTVEEAKALTESDPMIQSGALVMELHPWFGSAAMQLVGDLHRRGEKNSLVK